MTILFTKKCKPFHKNRMSIQNVLKNVQLISIFLSYISQFFYVDLHLDFKDTIRINI